MSDLQDLEQQRQDAQEAVSLRDAALRLSENKDFRLLFIDMYFKTEAARLVQMSGDPILTPQQREDALEMAKATGHTKRFLSMLVVRGNTVARDIEDLDQAIEQARRADDEAAMEAANAANGAEQADNIGGL
jgi:hypothetical protein